MSQSNSCLEAPPRAKDDARSIIARGNSRPQLSMTKSRRDCCHGMKCFDRRQRQDTSPLLNSLLQGFYSIRETNSRLFHTTLSKQLYTEHATVFIKLQ